MPVTATPRRMVPLADSQSDVTVANTTSITDVMRFTLPTNLVAGDTVMIDAHGYVLNNSGLAEVPTYTFGIGSTTMAGSPASMASLSTLRTWRLRAWIAVESTSLQRTIAEFASGTGAAAGTWITISSVNNILVKHLDSSEDLTSAKDVYFRVTFTAANANLSITARAYSVWKIPNV